MKNTQKNASKGQNTRLRRKYGSTSTWRAHKKKAKRMPFYIAALLISYGLLMFVVGVEYGRIPEHTELPRFIQKAQAMGEPETMKEWVLWRTSLAGMKPEDVDSLIYNESRWNPQATNKNSDGSYDHGLWMINKKYHPHVEVSCSYDYKCATEYAIKLWEKQGYRPWYGAKHLW